MRADTMDDQPCRDFFLRPRFTFHRRYEALRAFFLEGRPPAEVALQFGYKPAALKVLISRFRHDVRGQDIPPFHPRRLSSAELFGVSRDFVDLRRQTLTEAPILTRF